MNLVVVGTSWITDMFISAALETRLIRFLGTCSRSTDKAEAMNLKYGGEKTYLNIEEVCGHRLYRITQLTALSPDEKSPFGWKTRHHGKTDRQQHA